MSRAEVERMVAQRIERAVRVERERRLMERLNAHRLVGTRGRHRPETTGNPPGGNTRRSP